MSTTSAPRGLKPIGLLGGMPFAGFVNALSDVPAGSFVWNDMCACTQARWAASHTIVT